MKAVVKVDIVNGRCVVTYSDGSEQELYDYPSDEGGGGGAVLGTKHITSNGIYNASSDNLDGYSSVSVAVSAPAPVIKRKEITSNGTYYAYDDDCDGYGIVTVDVAGGGSGISVEDWLKGSQPTGDIVFNDGTTLVPALSNNAHISSFVSNTVNKCQYDNTFNSCTVLKYVRFMASMNNPIVQGFVRNCPNILTVSLPNFLNTVGQYSMSGCPKLHTVDIGSASYIQGNAFSNSALAKLIIRRSSVCPVQAISAFTSTPFASNGSGGTLYVPNALISEYQSASNWSTILGYANNSIVALEGSEFENATADGTPLT